MWHIHSLEYYSLRKSEKFSNSNVKLWSFQMKDAEPVKSTWINKIWRAQIWDPLGKGYSTYTNIFYGTDESLHAVDSEASQTERLHFI